MCTSPLLCYKGWCLFAYLFQCHRLWHGLCKGLLLLESSWHCRFHQCWHESAYSHWVCVGHGKLQWILPENVLVPALSYLPLWGGGSKAQLFKWVVFIGLNKKGTCAQFKNWNFNKFTLDVGQAKAQMKFENLRVVNWFIKQQLLLLSCLSNQILSCLQV